MKSTGLRVYEKKMWFLWNLGKEMPEDYKCNSQILHIPKSGH